MLRLMGLDHERLICRHSGLRILHCDRQDRSHPGVNFDQNPQCESGKHFLVDYWAFVTAGGAPMIREPSSAYGMREEGDS
jgi:hypothetical protein